MATKIAVTRKGQITIPAKLRRKYCIGKNAKISIAEKDDGIVIDIQPSFLDLAGSGAGKVTVEEAKRILDEMRAEDDD
jgi:AbrB family looped-hinge helix DNA binding protein